MDNGTDVFVNVRAKGETRIYPQQGAKEALMRKITKDDIHIVSTPIKTRTRKVHLGFQWVDEDGNVIREIPPTPPCKQYLVIHPDRLFCHGVDVEEMLKGGLEYERVR